MEQHLHTAIRLQGVALNEAQELLRILPCCCRDQHFVLLCVCLMLHLARLRTPSPIVVVKMTTQGPFAFTWSLKYNETLSFDVKDGGHEPRIVPVSNAETLRPEDHAEHISSDRRAVVC
jgi:hypothetical protein